MDLLLQLDPYKSMGPDPYKSIEPEFSKSWLKSSQSLSHWSLSGLGNLERSQLTEAGEHHPNFQEGQEEGPQKLEAY